MQSTIQDVLADRIKARLGELCPSFLQKHYRAESDRLLHKWHEFDEPRHALVAWAMAKDFADNFPRHSYYEWAFVFGISKAHPLLVLNLRAAQVYASRYRFVSEQYDFALVVLGVILGIAWACFLVYVFTL